MVSNEPRQYDFIENAAAALTELPRYETIREDIQAVLDRNKLLDTVSRLTACLDADVIKRRAARMARLGIATPKPYEQRGLRSSWDSPRGKGSSSGSTRARL